MPSCIILNLSVFHIFYLVEWNFPYHSIPPPGTFIGWVSGFLSYCWSSRFFLLLSLSYLGFTVSGIKWEGVSEGGSGGGSLKKPSGGGGLLSWTFWICYQHVSVSQTYWTVLGLRLSRFPVLCVMRSQMSHRQRIVDRKVRGYFPRRRNVWDSWWWCQLISVICRDGVIGVYGDHVWSTLFQSLVKIHDDKEEE